MIKLKKANKPTKERKNSLDSICIMLIAADSNDLDGKRIGRREHFLLNRNPKIENSKKQQTSRETNETNENNAK